MPYPKYRKSTRNILANANPRDSIFRELARSNSALTIPSFIPRNMGELITWAGDLGRAAHVYACWAAVARYAREIAPSDEAAQPVVDAAKQAQRAALGNDDWPIVAVTAPNPEATSLALCAWSAWVAAGMPHLDSVATDTARALWYAAGQPFRRILFNASDSLREARKAQL